MKAAYLNRNTGYDGLIFGELDRPIPGRGDVLIKVHATAITPTELKWSPTFSTPTGEPRPVPIVLSHEFSGEVAEIGSSDSGFKVGDAVYGMNDWFANGALAEFCVAAEGIAFKPRSLTDAEAAAVPISALTAWQGLFERARLEPGERVLIHGGSGGVGVFAVQLAHWRGAHVIATASTSNLDFVRAIGADEAIDYETTRFDETVSNVDVLFDSVGGETLDRSWKILKPGGRAVTIAAQSETTTDERAKAAFFIVERNRDQLSEIGKLIDANTIRAFVGAVFPFDETREAFARAERGKMRGKVVVVFPEMSVCESVSKQLP